MDTHTKLNILGTLPVIGYVFDIANAISYFKEGKVAEGVESLIFALPTLNIAGGAGKIAQLLGKSKHSADIIGNTLQLCSTAAAAFTAACKTGTGVANIIDKYAVGGAPLDGQFIADVTETASYGLMTTVFGRMTYKDYQSYTEAANTVVKGTVVNNEEIKWYTEDDYLQEIASKKENDSIQQINSKPDFLVTSEGVVLPTNKDFNLVSTSKPTNQGGEYLQIHNGHEHYGVNNPHTHKPKVNIDPVSGKSSANRLPSNTSAEDINYADMMIREGKLRPRANKKDKGGY